MDQESDLKLIKEKIFLNIGKNIVLFQQIEQLLKLLVSSARIEIVADDWAAMRHERLEQIDKRSMGPVAGQFVKNVLSGSSADANDDSESGNDSQIRIVTSFRFESDEGFREERADALKAVIEQRNELVHAFLPKWDWKSVESMRYAVLYLLSQRESAEAMFKFLVSVRQNLQEVAKAAVEFLASDEAQRQFELAWLQQSLIVNLLREAVMTKMRPDGWLSIGSVGQIVNRHAKDDLENLRKRYGYRNLTELIAGCGVFDVRDEPTEKGLRSLYRLKLEREASIQ